MNDLYQHKIKLESLELTIKSLYDREKHNFKNTPKVVIQDFEILEKACFIIHNSDDNPITHLVFDGVEIPIYQQFSMGDFSPGLKVDYESNMLKLTLEYPLWLSLNALTSNPNFFELLANFKSYVIALEKMSNTFDNLTVAIFDSVNNRRVLVEDFSLLNNLKDVELLVSKDQ